MEKPEGFVTHPAPPHSSPCASVRSPRSASEYYSSFGDLGNKFGNVDDPVTFAHYMTLLKEHETTNFVLDFGDKDAWCAVNLEKHDIEQLLSRPKHPCFGTRWINIWAPEEQKTSIKTIMSHYGISERLQGMMCTDPTPCSSKVKVPPPVHTRLNGILDHSRKDDLEGAYILKELAAPEEKHATAFPKSLTFSQIHDQLWHFCTVDYGQRYTCIGYNSLYAIPNIQIENGPGLPDGKRLWSWLILCDDGTIISIQDNPYPKAFDLSDEDEQKVVVEVVRRNVRLIFAGASKQHLPLSESESLETIRIRQVTNVGLNQARIKQEDGPSLLFYYIFDDWMSSYGIIAKREHRYGVSLDRLRKQMLEHPRVELINELHWLGRRLGVLKRLYQSYELIMRRILQRQRLFCDNTRANRGRILFESMPEEMEYDLQRSTARSQSNISGISMYDVPNGVPLSSAAVGRFERLVDRIKLYCLSEIETCLVEKESLTFLNFNLIALKDSQAVEKLTRITVFLAKVTILFLPVSLMTAYFSTQIDDLQGVYTKNDYWVSFGVIMFLSIVVLLLFGYASGTVEGAPIYQPLLRAFFRSSKERLSRRQKE